MKSTLVIFLGLCVILANAQLQPDFSNWDDLDIEKFDATSHEEPGLISGLVNSFFEKVKQDAEQNIAILQDKLDKLVNKFVSQVMFFSEFSLMNAEDIARDAKAKLIMHNNNKTKRCREDFLPKLEDVITKGKESVENCVVKALGEVANIKETIQKYIDEIKFQVSNIAEVLEQCVNIFRPFKTTKCMLENIKNIASSISDIVSNTYKALKEASSDLRQIVANANDCIKSSANQTEINVKRISGNINDCLNVTRL